MNLYEELNVPAPVAAQRLLGCTLVRTINGKRVVSKIVETEAYDQSDAASHSFNGITPRTEVMFGPAGYLYVYFTYGMHYCCNVVCGPEGVGSAVLIRAVEPLENEALMTKNRGDKHGVELSNGPAKLCQALKIDKTLNGHSLDSDPVQLILETPLQKKDMVQTTRIGISKAKDELWRFYIKGNPYVSKT